MGFSTKLIDNSFTRELNDLEDRIFHFFESINLDDICLTPQIFLDEIGYSFVDKHPWTDVIAYQLEYEMPLGVAQYGSLLFLGGIQGYSQITRKIFELGEFSDFMLVMDPRNNSEVDYFDRDILRGEEPTPSPTNKIFHRKDVIGVIWVKILRKFIEDHLNSLGLYKATLIKYMKDKGIYHYWNLLYS